MYLFIADKSVKKRIGKNIVAQNFDIWKEIKERVRMNIYDIKPSEKSLKRYASWNHVFISFTGLDYFWFVDEQTVYFKTREDAKEFENRVRRRHLGVKMMNLYYRLGPRRSDIAQHIRDYKGLWYDHHKCALDFWTCPHIPLEQVEKMYYLIKNCFSFKG
jgi:hypothetical protein